MELETANSDPNELRERKKNPTRMVVIAGLLNEKSEVLLVRTRRLPNHWQPIGGGMEPEDPSPVDAILRELKEESSFQGDLKDLELVLTTAYDFGDGEVYFFIAHVDSAEPIAVNPEEAAEHEWFTIEDALQLNAFDATRKFLRYLKDYIDQS